MTPQPTEQYGQVFRVSAVRASLNVRTSARTRVGEKPSAPSVVAPMPEADSWMNCRRVNAMVRTSGERVLGNATQTCPPSRQDGLIGASERQCNASGTQR